MTTKELDELIAWCKNKLALEKKNFVARGRYLDGYNDAMLVVMGRLHCEKKNSYTNDDISKLRKERDSAEMCIDEIEDALNRGVDNDWARQAIEAWRNENDD